MRIHRFLCLIAFVLVANLSAVPAARACPACQDNINASAATLDINGGASGGTGLTSLESGYSWSVLFLMAMPFAAISILGWIIYGECRKIDSEISLTRSDRQKSG